MRVTNLIKILIVVFGALAGINILFSFLATSAKNEMSLAYEARHEFITATYDFNTLSMLLTRYARVHAARAYAGTGDEHEPYGFYWGFINNDTRIKDAVITFMENAPDDEIEMILHAYELSSGLRAMEKESFAAVAAGNAQLAMRIMYGGEIKVYINPLADVLQTLEEIMLVRIQGRVDSAYSAAVLFDLLMVIITIIFAVVSVSGTVYLLQEVKSASERESEASLSRKREEHQRKIAEEESHAKTQFLARMSHELRTPMNAVLGITEIELMKAKHTRETEEAFMRIHSSSSLLLTLINDILDLSKVEAGKMELVPAPYDISRLIIDTSLLNLMHVGSKNIKFELDVNENLPVSLVGDELRIKQILNNFLSNAFKYTEEGLVTLSVGKTAVKGDSSAINLIITVSDTGQGMTVEEISQLFESEYTRFNLEANRSVEGTGLGMTIARQLISMMNGKISAKSEVGEGSTFTIKIPQKISGNNVLGKEAVENLKKMKSGKATASIISPLAIEPMPYGKVLVVDDIESNLYVVEGYLHPYQVQLETVTSGMEAIEKIKAGNVYDVIFMDHMMPEMDGLEATKILREMGYSHPIVALTANTIKGAQELFMNNGFAGFIAKPIDIFQLNSQLVQHIRDKQTPEVLEAAKLQAVVLPKDSERPVSDKIAKSFLRDAERAIEILQQFVKLQTPTAEELKAYSIQAHGMKSALMNIEKPDLSKKAAILEAAANKGDTQTILSQTQEFINNVQAVKEELAPPESNEETHDEDPDLLKIQLQVIYDACELYDKKSFRNALKALREKTWSAKTNEALSALEAHLLRSEFEEAGELAKTLCS